MALLKAYVQHNNISSPAKKQTAAAQASADLAVKAK
jgi:hypothetical protein